MNNKSQLPENQDQKKYKHDDENSNWGERGFEQGGGQGSSESNYPPRQEGYDEDQPGKPVRSTGSVKEEQESGSIQPGDDRQGKH